jgi:anti-sigma factor RsiW
MECDACRRRLPAYGDNELSVESALDVEAHVRSCGRCRAALERQRTFSQTVGRLYPRAPLPSGLEERVRRAVRTAPSPRFWLNGLALAASVLLVLSVAWVDSRPRAAAVPASVMAAADIHRSARQQALPLAIQSSDAAAVNAWLAGALSFPINAPVRPTTAMRLEGATVVELAGERVGYVRYRRDGHPISLFLVPPRAWPQNGERVQVREAAFHLYTIDGLKLIAWNHPPLSYVLVSDLGGQGAQACAVCHSSMADAVSIALPRDGEI